MLLLVLAAGWLAANLTLAVIYEPLRWLLRCACRPFSRLPGIDMSQWEMLLASTTTLSFAATCNGDGDGDGGDGGCG